MSWVNLPVLGSDFQAYAFSRALLCLLSLLQNCICSSTDTQQTFIFLFATFGSHILRENMQYLSIWVQIISLHMVSFSWAHLAANGRTSFFLVTEKVFHCMYASYFLYLFIYWWKPWLIPNVGFCDQCCCKHGGVGISWIHCVENLVKKGFLFLTFLICLEGRMIRRKGERKKNFCHWLTLNWPQSWGWVRLKPGARNSIQVSHLGDMNSSTWTVICIWVSQVVA